MDSGLGHRKRKKRKDDAVRQFEFYIEKLEVYPSFAMAVGPSWVLQLWWGGLPLAPTCCYAVTWVSLV